MFVTSADFKIFVNKLLFWSDICCVFWQPEGINKIDRSENPLKVSQEQTRTKLNIHTSHLDEMFSAGGNVVPFPCINQMLQFCGLGPKLEEIKSAPSRRGD